MHHPLVQQQQQQRRMVDAAIVIFRSVSPLKSQEITAVVVVCSRGEGERKGRGEGDTLSALPFLRVLFYMAKYVQGELAECVSVVRVFSLDVGYRHPCLRPPLVFSVLGADRGGGTR